MGDYGLLNEGKTAEVPSNVANELKKAGLVTIQESAEQPKASEAKAAESKAAEAPKQQATGSISTRTNTADAKKK